MKTSIFYYTNNVLAKPLLQKTLFAAAEHAKDRELLVSSHFPLTKEYETVGLGDTSFDNQDGIYSHIVRESWELPCENIKSYVVGKKPYHTESIYEQLLHLLENAQGENIILMEHDCLYPDDYVEAVEKGLEQEEIAHVSCSHVVLNYDGFWHMAKPISVLSGHSFKKEVAIKIFSHKLQLNNSGIPCFFEPLLSDASERTRQKYPEDMIMESHICIDDLLLPDHEVLDIKHGMNQNGYLAAVSTNKDAEHPYWGQPSQYLELINTVELSPADMAQYGFGLSMY